MRKLNYSLFFFIQGGIILPPSRLFKYLNIDRYSIHNLKNLKVYFNNSSFLNDPFDFLLDEIKLEVTIEDIINLYNDSIDESSLGNPHVNNFSEIPQDFKNNAFEIGRVKYRYFITETFRNKGVYCFSSINDNILLWSHYAGGHRGICLEFDSKQFDKALEMKYFSVYPSIRPIDQMRRYNLSRSQDMNEEILLPLLSKSIDWSYEKEWRIFHEQSNYLFGYEPTALKSVYFGLKAERHNIELISSILRNKYRNVNTYKAVKNRDKYKIDFIKYDIMS